MGKLRHPHLHRRDDGKKNATEEAQKTLYRNIPLYRSQRTRGADFMENWMSRRDNARLGMDNGILYWIMLDGDPRVRSCRNTAGNPSLDQSARDYRVIVYTDAFQGRG